MIFVTVGAQMPFDRLVRTVDSWASQASDADVFAQIGRSSYRPRHMRWVESLDPVQFRQHVLDADLVITHAGMGTMITAMEFSRRLLVMPRRGDLLETRNDHQFGTARAFQARCGVGVAWDEQELRSILERPDALIEPKRIASHASFELLNFLRSYIQSCAPGRATQTPLHAAPLAIEQHHRKAA
jgi:UDP-N-acetylglucosamine transferase subunit ALG13